MKTEIFLHAFISYFVVIDPIGVSLIFNSLTSGHDSRYIQSMALRAVVISTIIVLLFGFWGNDLLKNLGISIDSFRIAGGLLLFYTAFHMITKGDDQLCEKKHIKGKDISVYPLSIPLIAGPGCLTLTILLFSQKKEGLDTILSVVVSVLVIYSITLACFFASKRMAKIIGTTGNNIIKRVLGVLLASLSIQFIIDGIKGFLS